jgi:gas vesicle protein
MNKGTLWIIGLLAGAFVGILLIVIFAPVTGKEFRHKLQISIQETLADAQRASQERQADLETKLAQLQSRA